MEIWKNVNGYEGLYQISNMGRVRSMRKAEPLVLKPRLKNVGKGYWHIELYSGLKGRKAKKMLVHRLVASAFISNPENKPFVNHIDGTPTNNHVTNLEWCTHKENMHHALRTGLSQTRQKFTTEQAQQIRKEFTGSYVPLAKKYNVDQATIRRVIKGTSFVYKLN